MNTKQFLGLGVGVAVGITGLSPALANASSDNPFIEIDGKLIVEIESLPAAGNWSTESSIFGFSGDSYRVWRGQNNFGPAEASRGEAVTYHFTITTPGNYELRWRSRNTEGLDATEHNDSWVRFQTGENIEGQHPIYDAWTKAYMGHAAQWTWDTWTVDHDNMHIRQYFAAGDHTIEIGGRSNGHAIDRFSLYQYENIEFTSIEFNALAESPRQSELGVTGHTQNAGTCFANVLSVPASQSAQVNATNVQSTGDVLSVSDADTLLHFDYPEDVTGAATLVLGSRQSALNLTAYIASHDDWDRNTDASALPVAQTALGTLQTSNAENTFVELTLDASVLNSGTRTIILSTDNASELNSLYGVGTRLEPRLDIAVSTAYCNSYNLQRTGTGDPDTNVADGEEGLVYTDDAADDGEDQNIDNSTAQTENASGDQNNESVTENPFEPVEPSETVVDAQDLARNSVDATSSGGGSTSLLGLLVLLVTGFGFRANRLINRI